MGIKINCERRYRDGEVGEAAHLYAIEQKSLGREFRLRTSLVHAKSLKQVRGSTRGRGCGGLFSRTSIVWWRNSEDRKCGCLPRQPSLPRKIGGGSAFKIFWAVTLGVCYSVTGRGDTCLCLAGCQDSHIVVAGASHGRLMFLSAWLRKLID
jgi:hypothetical protein